MKTGGGDFSAEAYEQLREAYAKQQQEAVDQELAGTQLMGQEYGLETLPVDSPWKDRVENWKYPDGKSEYEGGKQSPDEILQIMRESAQERIDAKKEEEELEEMSDEEFDKYVDELLEDDEDESESEEDEDEDEEENESEEEEDEEEDETEEEESDTPDSEESEDESEPDEVEDEAEVEDQPDAYVDAEEVASQIAELRAQIEAMSFVPESQEEPETDDES